MSRTIKEAEELTKVTSQNIRYYEKQGLPKEIKKIHIVCIQRRRSAA